MQGSEGYPTGTEWSLGRNVVIIITLIQLVYVVFICVKGGI